MRLLILFTVMICLTSCKKELQNLRTISKVEIENSLEDSLLNVRALEIDVNKNVVFATATGWLNHPIKGSAVTYGSGKVSIKHDSIIPNFRALATTSDAIFVLSITSPALLFKVENYASRLVYQEIHTKAFYDAMNFWNDQEGIAIGDPTEDCMSIIITRNAGETWTKLSCDNLPKAKDGEAAFAASDTNIAIVGDHTWVATGGMASRILYSPDKGKTWEVYNTPIVQNKATTGMYSIDFYDELNGFAIGGDYTKPNDTLANKISTKDGGKTWQVVANGKGPGYRSCVQYVPNSNAKELVAVGFKGVDYSNDAGESWKHLSDEGFYTLRFLNDSVAYAAGRGRVSKLTFK